MKKQTEPLYWLNVPKEGLKGKIVLKWYGGYKYREVRGDPNRRFYKPGVVDVKD